MRSSLYQNSDIRVKWFNLVT